ncbi:MAG: hypothetical protein K1X44_02975 [Alphaproteobacteria bacterium]|nr:hypothetical protein [Alphaproteobacteria bacterium]
MKIIKIIFLAVILLSIIGGCSLFAPKKQKKTYQRNNVGAEQATEDLEGCKQQAAAVLKRDSTIDQDISRGQDSDSGGIEDTRLAKGLNEYDEKNRYQRLVDECMDGRGYNNSAR